MNDQQLVQVRQPHAHADFILLFIPSAFVATYTTAFLALGAHLLAIASAALVCGLALIDAIFWHPPTESY